MSILFQKLFGVLREPAGEGTDLSAGDRGDDFEPTGDDAVAVEEDTSDVDEVLGKKKPEPKADAEDDEDDEDEKDEKDEDDDKPKGKKEPKIPLSRHKALLEKSRAERETLERKLEQYEKGNQLAVTNERITSMEKTIEELDKEYAHALTDGEHEKAAEIMRKIRASEREVSDLKVALHTQAAESRAVEKARFDVAVERVEEAYPQLDPKSDEFDEALVSEVLELQRGFVSQNYTPTKALQKAVKYVMGADTGKQKDATSVNPRVDKTDVAAARKAEAARKSAQAVGKTPPAMKAGLDSDRTGQSLDAKQVTRMTQEQFAKLADDELAKLRGDSL